MPCDWHGSWLAGENPDMALGRREHVGEQEGRGADDHRSPMFFL
ncbi:MAG: hypothetical protein P8179_24055 [Candidatus Thiodiazotropha sp.]